MSEPFRHNCAVQHAAVMSAKPEKERTPFDEAWADDEVAKKLATYDEDDAILVHLGFAPSNLVNDQQLHKNYKLLIATDATHIKHPAGGNVFDAVMKDANGEVVPVLYMVSYMNESTQSWTDFMQAMKNIYGDRLDHNETVFLMDGDKGGRSAINSVWARDGGPRSVNVFFCSNHLVQTVIKAGNSMDGQLFLNAVHAKTKKEVDALVEKMSPAVQKKLVHDMKAEEWSLICSGKNFGECTSSIVEGNHATLVAARHLNMIGKILNVYSKGIVAFPGRDCLQVYSCCSDPSPAAYYEIIDLESRRFSRHKKQAYQCLTEFPPSVQSSLTSSLKIVKRYGYEVCRVCKVRVASSQSS